MNKKLCACCDKKLPNTNQEFPDLPEEFKGKDKVVLDVDLCEECYDYIFSKLEKELKVDTL